MKKNIIKLMVGDSEHNRQHAVLVETENKVSVLKGFHKIACDKFGIKWWTLCEDYEQTKVKKEVLSSLELEDSFDLLVDKIDQDEEGNYFFRPNTFAMLYMYLCWLASNKTICYQVLDDVPSLDIDGYGLGY